MSEELQHNPIEGRSDYIDALDTVCGLAQHSLLIFEKNFEDIGFNSEARYNTLRNFLLASPSCELHLLAHDPLPISQYCPRLIMLLRQFGQSMHIYQTPKHLQHLTEPFAVADETHYLRRFHFDSPNGILAQNDPETARLFKARFEEMWASSHVAVTPTALGL